MSHLEAPIALLDGDGYLRFCNSSFLIRFGQTQDAVFGKKLEELLLPGSVFSWNEFKKNKLEKYKVTGVPDSFGSLKAVSGRLILLEDGQEVLLELERETDPEKTKRIAAVISRLYHDLQEPIRNLSSFLKLLSDRYSSSMEPKAAEFLGISLQSAERLWMRISGLLRFLRLEKRTDVFRRVSLENVWKETVRQTREKLEQNGFVVLVEGKLPEVNGDFDLLEELFLQLVHNSIRFRKTSTGSELKLVCEEQGSFHKISVRDNGIGADLKGNRSVIIFKKYHELEGDDRPGTGLFFCESIVDLHGGRLEIDSEPDEGFTVGLFFPKISGTVRTSSDSE
ncbi:histidine kinase [Leptospira gomenensis]|uniref:histidine kinase n=1 Tax=Leptospira gomenensis TaxID=2484974 RepID=A0A5F1YGE9_9LEPT|nr:ATP-binding protein [Leptospira gomenensis]TGK37509.1 histidine kinase [Leptospira gomenensis]TGK39485.1 histidine kinase [Leptospira gomenensis]TGK43093.1 histidine kinase [Leptospira gomenensis]TGK55078.1 histidine kinase [Leptospira gomenensis]